MNHRYEPRRVAAHYDMILAELEDEKEIIHDIFARADMPVRTLVKTIGDGAFDHQQRYDFAWLEPDVLKETADHAAKLIMLARGASMGAALVNKNTALSSAVNELDAMLKKLVDFLDVYDMEDFKPVERFEMVEPVKKGFWKKFLSRTKP